MLGTLRINLFKILTLIKKTMTKELNPIKKKLI